MTPAQEYLLPRDVGIFVAELLALVIVMASMWAAKRWGGAADRDYLAERPAERIKGPPVKPATPLAPGAVRDNAPDGFRLPIAGLQNASDAGRSH